MNLNINYEKTENEIKGYTNISLSSKTYLEELNEIPLCSCNNILANDSLNRLPPEETLKVLNTILQLVAIGGKVSLQILDFKSLATSYLSGDVEPQTISNIVGATKSIIEINDLINIFTAHNVKVEFFTQKGASVIFNGVKNAIS